MKFYELMGSGIYLRSEIKRYLLCGIVLSSLMDGFDDSIYSIDHISNFLSSTTHYNDSFAKKFSFPSIKELQDFTTELVGNFVAKKCSGPDFEGQNWLQLIEKEIFLNHESAISSKVDEIMLINFNYDSMIEWHFVCKNSPANSDLRKESLKNLIKKFRQSHVYGALKSHGGPGLIEDVMDNIGWVARDLKEKKRIITFGGADSGEKVVEETSSDQLNKVRSEADLRKSREISLIRKLNSEDIKTHFNKFKNSSTIYFLGFGFDNWNLRNIGIYGDDFCLTKAGESLRNKVVYATNYGDLPRVRMVLEKVFGVRLSKESEVIESSGNDGKKITHSFWRSQPNDRNNNVFISTKSVYRALTEDFI